MCVGLCTGVIKYMCVQERTRVLAETADEGEQHGAALAAAGANGASEAKKEQEEQDEEKDEELGEEQDEEGNNTDGKEDSENPEGEDTEERSENESPPSKSTTKSKSKPKPKRKRKRQKRQASGLASKRQKREDLKATELAEVQKELATDQEVGKARKRSWGQRRDAMMHQPASAVLRELHLVTEADAHARKLARRAEFQYFAALTCPATTEWCAANQISSEQYGHGILMIALCQVHMFGQHCPEDSHGNPLVPLQIDDAGTSVRYPSSALTPYPSAYADVTSAHKKKYGQWRRIGYVSCIALFQACG
jgi:hypothetical protein